FHLQSSETLNNLSPDLIKDITLLLNSSLEAMASIFEDGINRGVFIDEKPSVLANILWSLFSGIVLWEESKRIMNEGKSNLKLTLEIPFEIFCRGIKK
ncbi:MAG: TetR/AcrR family transcriptional regulator, partial [Desulfobacterales bacterium]|nr:TetR/AcrR family transcriptional regulator [Desulfobacterales bacterium]